MQHQISVRLHRQHDMDLIRLYLDKDFKFTTEMRNALVAHCRGKQYTIDVSDSKTDYKGYLRTSILAHIVANDKDYAEIMRVLQQVKRGQRNAFIKAVMRRCIVGLPLSAYYSGDGIIMSKDAADMEEMVQARQAKEKKKQESNKKEKQTEQKTDTAEAVKPAVIELPKMTVPNPLPPITDSNPFEDSVATNEDTLNTDQDDILAMLNALAH